MKVINYHQRIKDDEIPLEVTKAKLEADIALVSTGRFYGEKFFTIHPNVKAIFSNTTSNQLIDMAFCEKQGIKVFTLEGHEVLQRITATAEWTVALIFLMTHQIINRVANVHHGRWDRYGCYTPARMLSEMTVGVIGMGRLGRMVGQRLIPMAKGLTYYDKKLHPDPHVLDNLLKDSDIVTVHIHLEGNEKMFDSKLFKKFKKGAYFINTSRGEIVNDHALVMALESGQLAGYAADVLSGEFAPKFDVREHVLFKYSQLHSNIVLTPHVAGSTQSAWEMTEEAILEAIKEFAGGRHD